MTSERTVFVWVHLPGDTAPTLCGRFDHTPATPEGRALGTFVYARSYLESRASEAIDPLSLPLSGRGFEEPRHDGVFGVIADAVPDDWGRYVIDRMHGAQSYPGGYLLKSLDDTVGRLSFTADRTVPEAVAPPPSSLLDEAQRIIAGLDAGSLVHQELDGRLRVNTGMGGARPKLTVVREDGQQWLAKFESFRDDRRYSNTRLEAAMLDLATRCGISSAQAQVVQVGGRDVLLVRRFDRLAVPGGWARDAYLSARCVFMASTSSAYSFGGSYPRLARELSRLCGARAPGARRELFRRMVFNCLVSNTDDHDRNHGLVVDDDPNAPPGQFRLAPAFDIVPRLHATQRRGQAMQIGDQGSVASLDNILSSAAAFGIDDAAEAQRIVEELVEAVGDQWRACLEGQALDREAIELLSGCFRGIPAQAPSVAETSRLPDRPRRG